MGFLWGGYQSGLLCFLLRGHSPTPDLGFNWSKHAGVLAAFREHFVKPGLFPVADSYAYGEAFELRNVTDYETLGRADEAQAQALVESATGFGERCESYLTTKGYL